jgi:hypothetical protein
MEGQGKKVYAVDGKTSLPGCDFAWSAGDVYQGGYKGDKRHGACTYTFFNGVTAQFTWVDGTCAEFNARQAEVKAAHAAKFSLVSNVLQRLDLASFLAAFM